MNMARTNSRATPARMEIVERAEQLLRGRTADPPPIAHLSQLIGVSERGLRNAFNAVRGMSPKRFVIHDRLSHVHRALSGPRATGATVTDIATEHGFCELGRFAGRYKAVFGETPSATRRGNCQAE